MSSQVTLMIILGDPSLMWASLFLVLGLIVWATTRETESFTCLLLLATGARPM